MNKLTGILFLSAFVLSMNALPAVAGDNIVTKSQVVKFGDLNLASDAGAQALYQRIKLAARRVCAGADTDDRFGNLEYRNCMKQAVDNAVAKIDRPTLTTVAQQSGKKAPPAG